ncbi:hypothetical protein D3C74_01980 [compost metagenome]
MPRSSHLSIRIDIDLLIEYSLLCMLLIVIKMCILPMTTTVRNLSARINPEAFILTESVHLQLQSRAASRCGTTQKIRREIPAENALCMIYTRQLEKLRSASSLIRIDDTWDTVIPAITETDAF